MTAEEQHKFWTVEMSNVKTNENNFSPRMPMIYDFHMICQDTINIKIKEKIEKVCNKNICKAYKTERGALAPYFCKTDSSDDVIRLDQVAGNHHISNLETQRNPIHQSS